MSLGGATWATAGGLSIGGTNAFDLSTTSAGATEPFFPAFWTYFARAAGLLSLDTAASAVGDPALATAEVYVYTGTESSPTLVASGVGGLAAAGVVVNPGVTYTIVVGTTDPDGDTVTSYDLAASFVAFTPTGPRMKILDGPVSAFGAPSSAWYDGDDSTYVDLSAVTPGPRGNWGNIHANYPDWHGLDLDPAWVTAIGTRFRAGPATGTSSGAVAVQLDAPTSRLFAIRDNVGVPVGINDIEVIFDGPEYDTSGWAPAGLASALAEDFLYLRMEPRFPSTTPVDIRVYEQHLVIYYTIPAPIPTGSPPLRTFPRADGRGTSSARRTYPTPPSVQASNRRAGGYL